ncbi:MAG: hypothetical protein O3C67_09910, partial [Cyanobacteria bacterium]|nr:hypothetical protein [Cyanobacteriota bacterium]
VVMDAEETAADKRSTLIGLVFLSVPPAAVGGAIVYSLRQSHHYRQITTEERQAEQLKQAFYQLVEAQGGAVTVFQFAKAADVDAQAARDYLDAQATAFNANFEVGDNSEIIYRFPV